MKKVLFLFATLFVATTLSAQQFTLSGVAPTGAKQVYLQYLPESVSDSVSVDAAGQFVFRGNADGKHIVRVFTTGEQHASLVVFAEGAVTADLVNLEAHGNAETDSLTAYQACIRQLTQPVYAQRQQLMDKRNSGAELTEEDLAAFYAVADSVEQQMMQYSKRVLAQNATMRFPAYIVLDGVNDFSREDLIALDVPTNAFMKEPCLDKVRNLIEAYRRTQVGTRFVDFEMADTAGVMHRLSEFVGTGHYVLIDFWATWCGPCMRELPNVKALYDKYHERGFDIVGISFDTEGENWRAVIQRKEMNWIHLSDLGGWKSLPVDFYGVRAIPFTMLIAPDGTILQTNLAGERLSTCLSEIFDQQ
ncbi:MAG: TlpA family protein disulfide reductase [Bacteroidaceae bacterium]|nr:TlpA family protein disulfide reductase [Bacteroidaceae bacterium]